MHWRSCECFQNHHAFKHSPNLYVKHPFLFLLCFIWIEHNLHEPSPLARYNDNIKHIAYKLYNNLIYIGTASETKNAINLIISNLIMTG